MKSRAHAWAAFGVCVVLASPAAAHTPGLSQGTYRVDGRRVGVDLVLARGEAAKIVKGIDGDRDGVLTEIELLQGQEALTRALGEGVEIRDGEVACPGAVERVTFVEEDGLAFAAVYTCPEGQPLAAVTIRLPLLGRLAGGHRHVAQVWFVGASAGPVDLPVDFVAQRRRPGLTIRRPTVPAEFPPSPPAPSAMEVVAAPTAAPVRRIFAGLAGLLGLAAVVVVRLRGRRRRA